MRALIAVLALVLGPAPGAVAGEGSALLQQIASQLAPPAGGLEGDFRQSRQPAFLERPLVSTGHFRLVPGGELRWQVEEPAPSVMLMEQGELSLDGRHLRDGGIGRLIQRLLEGFNRGDFDALLQRFEVVGTAEDGRWHLRLIPLPGRLADALTHIDLRGGRRVERVTILEPGDVVTVVEFSGVTPLGEAPREAN